MYNALKIPTMFEFLQLRLQNHLILHKKPQYNAACATLRQYLSKLNAKSDEFGRSEKKFLLSGMIY